MLAKNALNTSLEAKRLAQETLAMPDEADREIQMLRQKYDNFHQKCNREICENTFMITGYLVE